MHAVAKKTGAKGVPTGDQPTWKDLRSVMACYLFKAGSHSDDINLRLGHTLSSRELDVYVSYLAVNREKPKLKLEGTRIEELRRELAEKRSHHLAVGTRLKRLQEENETIKSALIETRSDLQGLKQMMDELFKNARMQHQV